MTDFLDEFPQDPDTLYLNHAAVAPWPLRTQHAVCSFARENVHTGARYYPRWLAVEKQLKTQLCELIGAATADDIALLKNTSEGLSLIAMGLDWTPGDEVVITAQEFPSNRIPWQALADRGVITRQADISGNDPEQAIFDCVTPQTRLISVSSVQFGTGIRLDLDRIGHFCRAHNVLFCIDAIQSLGVVPMNVEAHRADFVIADGHKWMLGPEGLALFWARPSIRPQLKLLQYGWHMIEQAGDYTQTIWQPAASAQRFECGSPNLLSVHALSASLSLLLEVGIATVQQRVTDRVEHIISRLQALAGFELITPQHRDRRAGIVTFVPHHEDVHRCFERLRDAGVVCAERGGGIRFSPHFYTPFAVIDRALDLLSGSPQ